MPGLILVKHSLTSIKPDLPASQWHLSEQGRRRCWALADKLALHRPVVIVTSTEPKAVETGHLVADRLGVPCETADGLHEHDRRNVGFLTTEEFEARVAEFFARPAELVFGSETADQAHARFRAAVDTVLARYPDQAVAIVAHGTVMTLFVVRTTGLAPFPFWKQLGLPSFVVMSRPDFRFLSIETSEALETLEV